MTCGSSNSVVEGSLYFSNCLFMIPIARCKPEDRTQNKIRKTNSYQLNSIQERRNLEVMNEAIIHS